MSPAEKALIVTGDDFGLSPLVNEAIIRAHQEGVLTSASLLVNGSAFDEAVGLAKENPGLDVGIHVSLLRGVSILPPSEVSPLVDPQGRFPRDPVAAGFRYFFERRLRAPLEKEMEAQIRKFLSAGLVPSHIDGHIHIHVHPTVFNILVRLAEKYSIPAFRLPREELWENLKLDPRDRIAKGFHSLAYGRLCAYARKKLRPKGIFYPDRFLGLLSIGRMNESYLMNALDRLQPGVTEIGLHPALSPPPELGSWAPHYEYDGEYRALLSPRVRELIHKKGIHVTTYRELCGVVHATPSLGRPGGPIQASSSRGDRPEAGEES